MFNGRALSACVTGCGGCNGHRRELVFLYNYIFSLYLLDDLRERYLRGGTAVAGEAGGGVRSYVAGAEGVWQGCIVVHGVGWHVVAVGWQGVARA